MSLAGSGVEIVHGNLIVSAAEVGVCVCDVEDGAIAPSDVCIDWTLFIAWSLVSDGCF